MPGSKKNSRKKSIPLVCAAIVVAVAICAFVLINRALQQDTAAEPATAPAMSSNVEENAAPTGNGTPYVDPNVDPSYYQIINRSNPIEPNYIAGTGELTEIEGKQMETNAAAALAQMVADLRGQGMDIIIQSGYRTDSDQEFLYDRQIQRQNGNEEKAATISAKPLTSEHQAGLAVDLSVDGTLTEAFGSTEQGKWLYANCMNYGFILRYQKEKTEFTGIISEPWHFRFVGSKEQATAIMNSGMCMEEYFGSYLREEDIAPYRTYLNEIQ